MKNLKLLQAALKRLRNEHFLLSHVFPYNMSVFSSKNRINEMLAKSAIALTIKIR